jgi:hypothetical protein
MSIQFGIGFSNSKDNEQAAREAVIQAKANIKQNRIDLAMVFSTSHYEPSDFLPVLRATLSESKIIGCSTAGLLVFDRVETSGFAILLMQSDDVNFGISAIESASKDPFKIASARLARQCLNDFGTGLRSFFLLLTDGVIEDTSGMIEGLQDVFGNIFPIIGAGSCDDFKFQSTFQIYQNEVRFRSVIGLLIGGHIQVGIGARHGWRPLGKPRIVTKSEGNIIRMINGYPAANLYEEFFGDHASQFQASRLGQMSILYPLGIYVEGGNEYLLRKTIDIFSDGGILCQGDIPQDSEIHIMIGNSESCKEAAREATQEALRGLIGRKPELIFVIESMARLKLLGRNAKQELGIIREIVGDDPPIFGFYSDGEIAPFTTLENIKKPYWQNESLVVSAIG